MVKLMYYFKWIYLLYRFYVSLIIVLFFIDSEFLQNLVAKAQGVNNNNIEPEDSTSENVVDKNNAGKMHTLFLCNQCL